MMINRYKKIPYVELENMRNKLFHTIYMQITEMMLTDEGQKQLEAEAMGGTASLLAAMGGASTPEPKNSKKPQRTNKRR